MAYRTELDRNRWPWWMLYVKWRGTRTEGMAIETTGGGWDESRVYSCMLDWQMGASWMRRLQLAGASRWLKAAVQAGGSVMPHADRRQRLRRT